MSDLFEMMTARQRQIWLYQEKDIDIKKVQKLITDAREFQNGNVCSIKLPLRQPQNQDLTLIVENTEGLEDLAVNYLNFNQNQLRDLYKMSSFHTAYETFKLGDLTKKFNLSQYQQQRAFDYSQLHISMVNDQESPEANERHVKFFGTTSEWINDLSSHVQLSSYLRMPPAVHH